MAIFALARFGYSEGFEPSFKPTNNDLFSQANKIYASSPAPDRGVYEYGNLLFSVVVIDTNVETIKHLEGTAMLRAVAQLRRKIPERPRQFTTKNRLLEKRLDDDTGIYRYALVYRREDLMQVVELAEIQRKEQERLAKEATERLEQERLAKEEKGNRENEQKAPSSKADLVSPEQEEKLASEEESVLSQDSDEVLDSAPKDKVIADEQLEEAWQQEQEQLASNKPQNLTDKPATDGFSNMQINVDFGDDSEVSSSEESAQIKALKAQENTTLKSTENYPELRDSVSSRPLRQEETQKSIFDEVRNSQIKNKSQQEEDGSWLNIQPTIE